MRNANRFDAHDAGFVNGIDPRAARRQFNMSIGLMTVLTVATLAVTMTLRLEPSSAERYGVKTVQAPQIVTVKHADNAGPRAHGG